MNVSALLSWYRRHRRDLPWRQDVSPYRTLVSELMLQQTRVDTVIPYFHRFLASFPTPQALAEAPLERVLEHWSGLGYYSRARNLHAAAVAVVAAGAFPDTVDGLRALPGVGPYTAGAIASIALGLDAPLVDGNVERVLSRHGAIEGDPKANKALLWAKAASLLPKGEAGDFNQALMELGATVCLPRNPSCLICPVSSDCQGKGDAERYPQKSPPPPVPEAVAVAGIAIEEGRILLARRPEEGLLGGLWEPPGDRGDDLFGAFARRLGLSATNAAPLGDVVHVFTHLRLTTSVFSVTVSGTPDPKGYQDARWVPLVEADGMALSTLARKLMKLGCVPAATDRKRPTRRGPSPPSSR